jgi:hypothetical protein
MIVDKDLPENSYVHERRKVGSKTPEYVWKQQRAWAQNTRKLLEGAET